MRELEQVVEQLFSKGRGILAADESTASIEKRFNNVKIESTEENRRAYRNMLFTTPDLAQYVSGVIMFEETLKQKALDKNVTFPKLLLSQGILPGIKVDQGLVPQDGSPVEKVTEGLEGLANRLKGYKDAGAVFTKWRAVFSVGDAYPSNNAIEENVRLLCEYAVIAQAAGLVPIVEPEVLMDGDHNIGSCRQTSYAVLKRLMSQLLKHGVYLPGVILKPSMVVGGLASPKKNTPTEVAEATLGVFNEAVPQAIGGIAFLSGGQTPEQATENLNAIVSMSQGRWKMTFSFGRALQGPALAAWAKKRPDVTTAQKALHKRLMLNSLATLGEYRSNMESKR